ncbi:hypothetical protein [Jannaschia marina]|uniref:hypothetical protein n=1 Tax=Jannaschia marina TaxID=2741674 RepID=UPI0015C813D6|nr:hypothetical protein [Jannaschia marina]
MILLLGIGLLLPRAGAVLADLAGFDSVVICRGAELVTITMSADGEPIDAEIEEHGPCLSALQFPETAAPTPAWTAFVPNPTVVPQELAVVVAPSPWSGPPPHRGPPAV